MDTWISQDRTLLHAMSGSLGLSLLTFMAALYTVPRCIAGRFAGVRVVLCQGTSVTRWRNLPRLCLALRLCLSLPCQNGCSRFRLFVWLHRKKSSEASQYKFRFTSASHPLARFTSPSHPSECTIEKMSDNLQR